MAARCLAALPLWALVGSASAADLSVLPADIAAQAKAAAKSFGWYAANKFSFNYGDAATDELSAEQAISEMKRLGAGLLTESTVDDFSQLARSSGWRAAKKRHLRGVGQDEDSIAEHAKNLLDAGLADELVSNLREMCNYASWAATNERTHCWFFCDYKKDQAYFEQYARLIGGEVVLKAISFREQAAAVVGQKPQVVGKQTVDNSKSDVPQSATFGFWYTQGRTDSWSNKVGFTVGVKGTFKAGVIVADAGVELSFSETYEHTWSGAKSEGTTKKYSYPLTVPAHKTYQAKATVHQSEMEVPYELTLAIGDHTWTSSGIWLGVAVSASTYTVTDITPNSTTLGVTVFSVANEGHHGV
mmetsp:Transcript_1321/g.3796  ORF Transcript_1321/g.3796 Transcript_1321/m.3796 type:complete len:358 (-) Transcript_1321:161-1234(-)